MRIYNKYYNECINIWTHLSLSTGMFQTPLVSPGLPGNFLARSLPPFLPSAPSLVNSISSPSVSSNVPPSSPPPVESTSSPCPNLSPGQSPLVGQTSETSSHSSPLQLTPVLVESQIAKLAEIAERLVKALPHLEPKAQNSKKKICKDLEVRVLSSSNREWEIMTLRVGWVLGRLVRCMVLKIRPKTHKHISWIMYCFLQ